MRQQLGVEGWLDERCYRCAEGSVGISFGRFVEASQCCLLQYHCLNLSQHEALVREALEGKKLWSS